MKSSSNLKNVRIFNVKYSPNLGDGILSECLESALISAGADQSSGSIDLAARTQFGQVSPERSTVLGLLDSLPTFLRRQAVRVPLAAYGVMKWRPHYRNRLEGANSAVIGGGNLFSDMDLNFPVKLSLAFGEISRLELPCFIYGCGVGRDWSELGRKLVTRAIKNSDLKEVSVRDEDSALSWDRLFGDATGISARVVRDPGLLACDLFSTNLNKKRVRSKPVVGLGIMSHVALHYHGRVDFDQEALEKWYLEVVKAFLKSGYSVNVFTNGSPEDVACLIRIKPKIESLDGFGQSVVHPPAATPSELCKIISEVDVLVAHRMHAVIAAYSFGIPAVALTWDRKLEAFMMSVNRRTWMNDAVATPPDALVKQAILAHEAGLPEAERAIVVNEARQGVEELLKKL